MLLFKIYNAFFPSKSSVTKLIVLGNKLFESIYSFNTKVAIEKICGPLVNYF